MRPTVKICGLMREEDIQICVRHGADIVGFVVEYPRPVPWNLTARFAKELMPLAAGQAETCIVTGGSPDKVLELALEMRPDYVQLHCGENLADTAHIVSELDKCGVKVIKTVFPGTPNLEKIAESFCQAGVYALLFDPRAPDNAAIGGTADLAAFVKLRDAVSRPVILAGGITPGNVTEIIQKTDAQMIDLMTGVERSPGVKDEAKVLSLFRAFKH